MLIAVLSLSAQMGPASVEWESLTPREGARIAIQGSDGGPEGWWMLQPDETLTVDVVGSVPTRVESRALLRDGLEGEDAFYMLETTLDGSPFRYEANRSGADSRTTLEGYTVGTSDSDKFVLPGGKHTLGVRLLGVRLLAGQAHGVLVRVRQPE